MARALRDAGDTTLGPCQKKSPRRSETARAFAGEERGAGALRELLLFLWRIFGCHLNGGSWLGFADVALQSIVK